MKQPNVSINAAFFREIKDDHEQLAEQFNGLRQLVRRAHHGSPSGRDLVDRLFALCDQVAFHFAMEEAYGYFEDALESSPHLHEQSAKLKNEHSQLFVRIRDLAEEASRHAQHKPSDWDRVLRGFVEFDRQFTEHENAESALIQMAIQQDVGVGD